MRITKDRVYIFVISLLIFLTVGFIFSNSMPSIEESKAASDGFLEKLRPIFEFFVGKGNATEYFVRKLAHFAEFGALGFLLSLLFRRFSAWPFFISLAVAVSDETAQIFSQRGSQVQDVWLDFAGACFGFGVGMIIVALFGKRKRLSH